MITIIRYRNDTYFGLEGEIEYPSVMHSGFIDEERRIMENYRKRVEGFEKIREGAIFLNKVHAKKALDKEIPNWKEKFREQLKDIEYKLNHVHGFSGFEQLWKKEYTFYHINNTSIEDMTKQTIKN
jgi:hypothetical protein